MKFTLTEDERNAAADRLLAIEDGQLAADETRERRIRLDILCA